MSEETFKFPIPENDVPWSVLAKQTAENPSNNAQVRQDSTAQLLEPEEEGELSVDVYQNEKEIIVKTAIAGVSKKDLEISLNHDMLTIRGNRKPDEGINPEDYFYQECYWGKFSRSLILPINVNPAKVKAHLKSGVLTITLPKLNNDSGIINVREVE